MTITSFSELPLCAAVQNCIAAAEYQTPTPIQAAAIPHILAKRDIIGCAQTGTGKTAAFALPILDQLYQQRPPLVRYAPSVLVLSPTRELAVQIQDSFRQLGRGLKVSSTVVYGGVNQRPQVMALQRGVDVLVATPGRLLDLMQQGYLRLTNVRTLVLDEADRMLDMGFMPDLKRIVAVLPQPRQSLFFSATMPAAVAELANALLTDPVRVSVTPVASTAQAIEQRVLHVAQGEKLSRLQHLLRDAELQQVLVFTRTKQRADVVVKKLCGNGVQAGAIHGNKSQAARQRALQEFRHGRIRVLVATDIAARGLDVTGISHVINFDLPHEPESYVHRIGRTGRAGATGIALSFCDTSERGHLRAIEKLIRQTIPHDAAHAPLPIPEGEAATEHTGAHRRAPSRAPARRPGGPQGKGRKGPGRPQQGRSHTGRPHEGQRSGAGGAFRGNHVHPAIEEVATVQGEPGESSSGAGSEQTHRPPRAKPRFKGFKGFKGAKRKSRPFGAPRG